MSEDRSAGLASADKLAVLEFAFIYKADIAVFIIDRSFALPVIIIALEFTLVYRENLAFFVILGSFALPGGASLIKEFLGL